MSFLDILSLAKDIAPAVSVVSDVAGTVASFTAQGQAADASATASRFNAQIAKNNQRLAEEAAVDAEARGEIDATDIEARASLLSADLVTRAAEDVEDLRERTAANIADIANRAEIRVADVTRVGALERQRRQLETKALLSRQVVALAGNGIEVNTGSALDIYGTTAGIGALDAEIIETKTRREAFSIRQDAERAIFEDEMNARRFAFVTLSDAERQDLVLRTNAERQAFVRRQNAEREAEGYRRQGQNFRADVTLANMAAERAEDAGTIAQLGTVISGAGTVADKWYKFAQVSDTNPFSAAATSIGSFF